MSINSLINKAVVEQFDTIDAKIFIAIGINEQMVIKCCVDKETPKILLHDVIEYLQSIHDGIPIQNNDFMIIKPHKN